MNSTSASDRMHHVMDLECALLQRILIKAVAQLPFPIMPIVFMLTCENTYFLTNVFGLLLQS
jgi:hypothetical protein